MAKASRILTNRKILYIYGAILFIVGVTVTLLVATSLRERELRESNFANSYSEILTNRSAIIKEYNSVITEVNLLQDRLPFANSLAEKAQLFNQLEELVLISEALLQNVLEIDRDALGHDYPSEVVKLIMELQKEDIARANLNNAYLQLFSFETLLTQYQINNQKVINCTDKIDYSQTATLIQGGIEVCRLEVNKLNNITTGSHMIPITTEYVLIQMEYWRVSSELYDSIIDQDSSKAGELNSQLLSLNETKSELEKQSTDEITNFIEKLQLEVKSREESI